MDVEEAFDKFSTVLSDDEIKKLAEKYGVKDERERKLLFVPFFWLMVLSAVESSPRGCLSKMVAFFTATFPIIHPEMQVMGLSEMAIILHTATT
jgi:hypothetical protein